MGMGWAEAREGDCQEAPKKYLKKKKMCRVWAPIKTKVKGRAEQPVSLAANVYCLDWSF